MRELSVVSPNFLQHGGTFTGNPVSMAAGAESLQLLTGTEIARLNALGVRAREMVSDRVADSGWEVRGSGSLLRPYPTDPSRLNEKVGIWLTSRAETVTSTIPLRTTAILSSSQPVSGCALCSVTPPCVAQRVWPRP